MLKFTLNFELRHISKIIIYWEVIRLVSFSAECSGAEPQKFLKIAYLKIKGNAKIHSKF
jgi:hypothetical protein